MFVLEEALLNTYKLLTMKRVFFRLTIVFIIVCSGKAFAQSKYESVPTIQKVISKGWTDKIQVSGYMQFRNNDLYKTNPNMHNYQGDKTYGGREGFSIRRMRLKVTGWINPMIYFYLQTDFASDGKNLGQLRDAYADLYLDKKKEFRFRIGQSKVPYGFDNLQSSSIRFALDRTDGINSALKDERDYMMVAYYTPQNVVEIFNYLKKNNLKHSGNYGMAALGIYNGQLPNRTIYNDFDNYHIVGRFTYPFKINNQIIESGIQAYTGGFILQDASDGVEVEGQPGVNAEGHSFTDQRVGATFVLYPQPFGIQAEFNIGQGPEYLKTTNTVGVKNLHGGYATVSYRAKIKHHLLFPFAQYNFYKGGKKFELDARSYDVQELNIGLEWQPNKAFELVTMFVVASRRYEDSGTPDNLQTGQLVRIQAQINY